MDSTTFVMYVDFLGNCLQSNRDEEGAADMVSIMGTAGSNVSNYFLVTITTDVEF